MHDCSSANSILSQKIEHVDFLRSAAYHDLFQDRFCCHDNDETFQWSAIAFSDVTLLSRNVVNSAQ